MLGSPGTDLVGLGSAAFCRAGWPGVGSAWFGSADMDTAELGLPRLVSAWLGSAELAFAQFDLIENYGLPR